jgi:hypothetical protein
MGEGVLEDLEVVDEVDFVVGIPLEFRERDSFGVSAVEQKTVDNARSQLLYFGHADF